MKTSAPIQILIAACLTFTSHAADSARQFISAERALASQFGGKWTTLPQAAISAALVEMAESLPVGGALDLAEVACGTLDFRRVADGVQITGGREGLVQFGGGQHGIALDE